MLLINENELSSLSLGATVLGSGGGGDPSILIGQLHFALAKKGPVRIIALNELSPDALVIPMALVGAPLIGMERIPNHLMFMCLIEKIKEYYPNRELVLMPAEIGGCNAFTPLVTAALADLPVLNGDLIGRAFPKLNMCKPAILAKKQQFSFVANVFGEVECIDTHTIEDLENKVRALAIKCGCCALVATFMFTAKEQDRYVIPDSISRAIQLGKLLQIYQNQLSYFANASSATHLGSGMLIDVCHRVQNGFLMGYANLKTPTDCITLYYQNEYLLAEIASSNHILAETPDIIALIETRSGIPLTSESLRYGLQVSLLSFPAPLFWQEKNMRSYVNLQSFGLSKNKRGAYV